MYVGVKAHPRISSGLRIQNFLSRSSVKNRFLFHSADKASGAHASLTRQRDSAAFEPGEFETFPLCPFGQTPVTCLYLGAHRDTNRQHPLCSLPARYGLSTDTFSPCARRVPRHPFIKGVADEFDHQSSRVGRRARRLVGPCCRTLCGRVARQRTLPSI